MTYKTKNNSWEEYEWGSPKINKLDPLTPDECYNIADNMKQKELEKLGFTSKDDVFDFISREFTITE